MHIAFEHYFKKTEPSLSDFDIKSIENNLGFNISLQLRNCYLFSNGGDFIKSYFPYVCGTNERDGVWGIFDLYTMVSTFRTAESNFDFFGEVLEMSDKLFPFTISFYGRKIFIVHSGKDIGKIYISEEKDEERNFIPVRLIANSFIEFLDMLE